jgi:hypothetical protein
MMPGPDVIYECGACAQPFRVRTLLSGNTFGATRWSDGFMYAPMLPPTAWFGPCPHCHALIWLEDCKALGADPEDSEYYDEDASAPAPQVPTVPADALYSMYALTAQQLLQGIADSAESPARQQELRIYLMHCSNHGERKTPNRTFEAPPDLTPEIREANLQAIARLFESLGENPVLLGEVYRELGDFSRAQAMFAKADEKEQWAAKPLSAWAAEGDRSVRILRE